MRKSSRPRYSANDTQGLSPTNYTLLVLHYSAKFLTKRWLTPNKELSLIISMQPEAVQNYMPGFMAFSICLMYMWWHTKYIQYTHTFLISQKTELITYHHLPHPVSLVWPMTESRGHLNFATAACLAAAWRSGLSLLRSQFPPHLAS